VSLVCDRKFSVVSRCYFYDNIYGKKKKRDWVHYVWKKQIQMIGSGYSYRNDVKTFTVKKLEIRFFLCQQPGSLLPMTFLATVLHN
jgi:hypothetical protein